MTVTIELHHIKQKSEGGDDSYDNCIPLCFNCHADVGAYNTKHPKGRKYSEAELKEHRNIWYSKIKNSNGFKAVEDIILPKDAADPEIRNAIISSLSKTIERSPTQDEIEIVLNKMQITRGAENVSYEDYLSINGAVNELLPALNNPYYFPKLIETTLKKHIVLKVSECPFKEIIERLTLYDGVVNHYQLIVEAPIAHTGFEKVRQFWEREAPDLFGDHFLEIYSESPMIKFRYKKGSFWHDWSCLAIDLNKELSDGLVNIKYKWILYEK